MFHYNLVVKFDGFTVKMMSYRNGPKGKLSISVMDFLSLQVCSSVSKFLDLVWKKQTNKQTNKNKNKQNKNKQNKNKKTTLKIFYFYKLWWRCFHEISF